jgi:fatty-acyl-CoA synthase
MKSTDVRLDWFQRWSEYHPFKDAVIETNTGQSIQYGALNQLASNTALWLKNNYRFQGQRIAFFGEFSISFTVLFASAQKHNICIVPLNYRLSAKELIYLLLDSEPSLLVYDSKFETIIKEILKEVTNIPTLITESLWDHIQKPVLQSLELNPPDLDNPIFLLYTSGTTGKPKGVPYTHRMLTWNSIDTTWRLDLTSKDKTVMCLPPFHTGGLNVLFSPLLHRGGTIILQPKFNAEEALHLLEYHQCTIFMAVPTIVKMLAASKNIDICNLSNLRYMIVGGEVLPLSVIEFWSQKGILIRQGYGLTEAGPSVTSLHEEDCIRKRGSIGKVNFYIESKIVDTFGKVVTEGEAGELWLKGQSVMKGYWNNPDANEKSFEGEWYKTGDMVKEDEEGYLYMVDRIKNMYKSGGENIYPAEIERVLLEHPSISEVAVIGVPDETWGEVGIAYIVTGDKSTLEDTILRSFLETKIAKFKVPKVFRFVESIPLNDIGKIDRKKLLSS